MATGKDRQKQLAREHHERQMQRRVEREQKAKRTAIIGSTVGVVVVVGGIVAAVALLNGGDAKTEAAATPEPSVSDTAAPSASASPTAPVAAAKPYDPKTGKCGYVADTSGTVKKVGTPPAKVSPKPAVKTMTISTNLGDIQVQLDNAKAPCTVNSLEFLAKKNYYDGSKCHRLGSAQFPMLQCGDPTAKADGKSQTDGMGGPGYVMAEENLQGATYKRGVMAMAKTSAPGSTGSQFFLVSGDLQLSPDYTPVGTITKGLDILDKVNKAGVITPGQDGTGAPKETLQFKDVTISGKS
ncbi:peptidylprolyl isomerase [Nonomuraea sp. NBC_01738]|uniref:peptidylprolyl isomerase n=1 Tax=Nonomuraea sp. NBC_01738 TaxID=2976003 RepID=UPI002E14149F